MINWSDPRNVRRATRALGWSCAALRYGAARPVSRAKLDSVFGNGSNRTSAFLRNALLKPAGNRYNRHTGVAKSWYLNPLGVTRVKHLLKQYTESDIQSLIDTTALEYGRAEHESELISGNFEYGARSNRRWNPLQFYRRPVRAALFAAYGYIYDYDIRNAAPTLLYQLATSHGCKKLPLIEAYIAAPEHARDCLARDIGVETDIAKQLIIARFAGASMGISNSLGQILSHQRFPYSRLTHNSWFKNVSAEIAQMWRALKPVYHPHSRFNSRAKWNLYFVQERRVMSAVESYLKKNNTRRYFLEHDGWRTDIPVDLIALSRWVERKTDYVLDFTAEVIERDE